MAGEKAVRLKDVPRWDAEAPCPAVVGDEDLAHLAFYSDDAEDVTVVVTFWGCVEHRFAAAPGRTAGLEVTSPRACTPSGRRPPSARGGGAGLEEAASFPLPVPEAAFECLADGYTVSPCRAHPAQIRLRPGPGPTQRLTAPVKSLPSDASNFGSGENNG